MSTSPMFFLLAGLVGGLLLPRLLSSRFKRKRRILRLVASLSSVQRQISKDVDIDISRGKFVTIIAEDNYASSIAYQPEAEGEKVVFLIRDKSGRWSVV